MLLLQCPGCKNRMKYQQEGALDRKKRKRCVYCGKSFQVVEQIVSRL